MGLLVQNPSQPLPYVGPGAEIVRNDMANTQQSIRCRRYLAVGIDKIGGPLIEVFRKRISGKNLARQWLQSTLLCNFRQRYFSGLVRKIEIFQML